MQRQNHKKTADFRSDFKSKHNQNAAGDLRIIMLRIIDLPPTRVTKPPKSLKVHAHDTVTGTTLR